SMNWPTAKTPATTSTHPQLGQNCTSATPTATTKPTIDPTKGMKLIAPATQPIRKPKFSPTRDSLVDVAAESADRLGVLARQQRVQPFQHVVPVVEQIERHDRGHHEQADDADHRLAACPDGSDQRCYPGRGLGDHLVDIRAVVLSAEELSETRLE